MVHKFKQLDLNIVLDVYSGSVHVVDDAFYDMLDFIEEPYNEANIDFDKIKIELVVAKLF